MAKTKISEYDATAANNTDIDSINIAEGMSPSNVNNALREQMSHLKEGLGSGTPVFLDQTNDRVGVGTDSPGSIISTKETNSVTSINVNDGPAFSRINSSGNGQMNFLSLNVTGNGGSQNAWGGMGLVQPTASSNNADLFFFTRGSSIAERMRINSDGNVGIGTSPSTVLHINDASDPIVRLQRGGAAYSQFQSDSAGSLYISADAGNSGASSRIQFSVDNSEVMRIDSSGKVGIGTSSPARALHVSTGQDYVAKFSSTDASAAILIEDGNSTANYNRIGVTTHNMFFVTNNSEAMRIDSSGNLLVGTTSLGNADAGVEARANGTLTTTADSQTALFVKRIGSGSNDDGELVRLQNADGTVGSIGSISSDLYIAEGNSGLRFDGENNQILPSSTTASTNGTCNLGAASAQFKDLFLSGGVVFDAVAGNATSNTLDDYEEGTWTPTAAQGASGLNHEAANCIYTKIGRQVTLQFEITNLISPNGSTFNLGGIPFNAVQEGSGSVMYNNVDIPGSRSQIVIYNSSSSYLRFYALGDNTTWYALIGTNLGTSFNMIGQITYQTAT